MIIIMIMIMMIIIVIVMVIIMIIIIMILVIMVIPQMNHYRAFLSAEKKDRSETHFVKSPLWLRPV